MLNLINISKTFDANTNYRNTVIKDLNLKVNDGDFICIIGSNGSGKSTLFNLIAGSIYSDEGKIILDDENITMKPEHVRAHYIGRLFQDPLLGTAPDLTVYENIMLAAKNGTWLSVPNKKDKQLIKEKIKELNMGLEDRLNTPVRLLSGGQRQALTLIMATINPPKILLLDEHTAALDPQSANQVMELTKKIIEENKITCLMITHNMQSAIDYGNRLLMMHRGNIILDLNKQEKEKLTIDELRVLFKKNSNSELNNDYMLLD